RSKQYLVEQLEASQRFSALVESVPVGIVLADTELNIIYQNPASESGFVQLSSFLEWNAEVVVGRPLPVLFPDEEHARDILSDPDRLPLEVHGQIGPYGVRYLSGPVYDADGDHAGALLVWEVDSGAAASVEISADDGDQERLDEYPALKSAAVEPSADGSNNGARPEITARLQRGSSLVGRSVHLLSDQLSTITSMVEALCNEGDNLRRSLEDTRQRTRHAVYLTADRSEALWELVSEMGDLGERTRMTTSIAKRLQKTSEKADAISSGVSDLSDAIQHVVREARMEIGRTEGPTGGLKAVVDELQTLGKGCTRLKRDVESKLARIRSDVSDVASSLDEDRREVRAGVRLSRRADHALGRVERDLTDVDERTDLLTEMAVGQSEIGAHIADQLARLTELVDTTVRVAREHARMVEDAGMAREAGIGV
ncbi:MAG: PAS domain-containing protein, partial [Candidatus Latescibacteria bacterium]|nr:PAS domain-containing protein [Candidatus Latescibacterota bacterium]